MWAEAWIGRRRAHAHAREEEGHGGYAWSLSAPLRGEGKRLRCRRCSKRMQLLELQQAYPVVPILAADH